jgi:hypothetical protein
MPRLAITSHKSQLTLLIEGHYHRLPLARLYALLDRTPPGEGTMTITLGQRDARIVVTHDDTSRTLIVGIGTWIRLPIGDEQFILSCES